MSNNLGLFQWIRDGVRQSVLLGVTDALDAIGTPDDSSKLHPAIMSIGNSGSAQSPMAAIAGETVSKKASPAPRKRLGRSLKDIDPTTAK